MKFTILILRFVSILSIENTDTLEVTVEIAVMLSLWQ